MEQIVDAKEKLKQQKIYTHLMNNGEKALIVRWKQDVIDWHFFFQFPQILIWKFKFYKKKTIKEWRTKRISERERVSQNEDIDEKRRLEAKQ